MLRKNSTPASGRRAVAAIAALSLGLLGATIAATAANAAPVPGPVDDTRMGSLTIHKYAYPADGSQNPSGTGTDPTNPIGGVAFEVCRINNVTSLGNTSNLGWAQVNGLSATSSASPSTPLTGTTHGVDGTTTFPLSSCTTVTTAANGTAPAIANLPVGAYWVHETVVPAGVTAGAPFIVTVPTPADTTGGAANTGDWEYDVNVYPKNTRNSAPTKTLGDQPTNGVVLGDDIDYTIRQVIPALQTGQTYSKVVVTDTLDAKLDLVAGTVVVRVNGTTISDYTLSTTGDVITVTLGATARGALQADDVLTVDFTAKANATGVISNTAYVNVNDLNVTPGEPGTPTNPTVTRWGNVLGLKTDRDGNANLGGAEFEVYFTADTDGTCAIPATTAVGAAVTTVTSQPDGTIVVPGLWVGDTNAPVSNRCYILKEIVAPAGYVLPAGDAALTAVNVQADSAVTVPSFSVRNDQQLVPGLPLTGADGARALTVVGGALVLLSVGGVLVARRRRQSIDA